MTKKYEFVITMKKMASLKCVPQARCLRQEISEVQKPELATEQRFVRMVEELREEVRAIRKDGGANIS